MVSKEEVEAALAISPLFYEAAMNKERWPHVLELLRGEFGADLVQVSLAKIDTAQIVVNYFCGANQTAMRDFLSFDYKPGDDPRLERSIPYRNKPIHCRQLVSDQEFHASRIYNEVLKKHDFEYALSIQIVLEEFAAHIIVGLVRKKDKNEWNQHDIDKLQLYVPHLRQSLRVTCGFDYQHLLSSAFMRAFDSIRLAALVIDSAANVQYANAAAKALLEAGTAIWLLRGKIAPCDARAARQFREAVSRVASGIGGSDSADGSVSIILPRSDGEPNLHATICSVSNSLAASDAVFRNVVYAVVFIADPLEQYETDPERLQRLFGLTESEAQVMKAYGSGQSAPEIAKTSGRSLETVRSHLKAVRDKTGARTQAEIARLSVAVQR